MADKPDFRVALAEALAPTEETGAAETSEDTAAEAEVTETGSEAAQESGAETTEAAEAAETTETPSEGEAEASAETTEAPTEYFGIDLSALSSEERASIIAGYADRDKHIQQLLREKAAAKTAEADSTESPAAPAPADTEVVDEASDADILAALGLDPENNPDDAIAAKSAVPLARMALQLQAEVEGLKAKGLESETAVLWETSLTSLEAQYGALPEDLTHEDVMQQAAKAGIAEPVDAYWRIMGPARAEVLAAVKARREAATAKLKTPQAAQTRPKTDAPTQPGPLESKDVKSATTEAINRIMRDKGWSFDSE